MHPTLSACLAAAAMIYPSTRIHAEEPLKRVEEQKLLPMIRTMPEGLPKLAKEKQAAVFSVGLTLPTGDSVMNKGFFIDGRGLALCPLIFLCYHSALRFDASDGEIIAKPKVLAVFGEQHLALVKFAYNLAFMHLGRGELKEAERIYRKIISIVPERIDYIEGLQKVLAAKGDWKGVEELTSWILTLEDLYRSR